MVQDNSQQQQRSLELSELPLTLFPEVTRVSVRYFCENTELKVLDCHEMENIMDGISY